MRTHAPPRARHPSDQSSGPVAPLRGPAAAASANALPGRASNISKPTPWRLKPQPTSGPTSTHRGYAYAAVDLQASLLSSTEPGGRGKTNAGMNDTAGAPARRGSGSLLKATALVPALAGGVCVLVSAMAFALRLNPEGSLLASRAQWAAVWLLKAACPMASQIVVLAPMGAMGKIVRDGSTGSMSAMPYSFMMCNGLCWVTYAYLRADSTIAIANASASLFATYYLWVFARNCPRPKAMVPHALLVLAVTAEMALCAAGMVSPSLALDLARWSGCCTVVAMFAGPLAAIQAVLRERNCGSMQLGFTLAGTCNCLLWTMYGAGVVLDPFVWIPNFVGLCASVAQLALFAVFPARAPVAKASVQKHEQPGEPELPPLSSHA